MPVPFCEKISQRLTYLTYNKNSKIYKTFFLFYTVANNLECSGFKLNWTFTRTVWIRYIRNLMYRKKWLNIFESWNVIFLKHAVSMLLTNTLKIFCSNFQKTVSHFYRCWPCRLKVSHWFLRQDKIRSMAFASVAKVLKPCL